MSVISQNSKTDMSPKAAAGVGVQSNQDVTPETFYQIECFDRDGNLKWSELTQNRVVTTGLNKLLDATFKTGLASPLWYIGLVGPGFSDGASNSNSTFGSATANFAAGDAGRSIIIRGVGSGGSDLVTTISSVTNSTSIVLSTNTSSTATGVKFLFDARLTDNSSSHPSWSELTAYSETTRQQFTPGTITSGSVDNSAARATFTINTDNTLVGGLFLTDNSGKGNNTTGTLYGMAPFSSVGFRQVNSGDTLQITTTLTMIAT